MERLFINNNGECYHILFGQIGSPALLSNMNEKQYVICRILEENSWWHGEYFSDFDEAYEYYKKNFKE